MIRIVSISVLALVLLAAASPAGAQPFYSIDFQGPSAALVNAGDVLTIPGTPPAVAFPVGLLGLVPGAAGQPELDALSFGNDPNLPEDGGGLRWYFSVDEFAIGFPGAPVPPNVSSEGLAGNTEASADVYRDAGPLGPGPFPPGPVVGNTGVADGDGAVPFPGLPLGLAEPNPANVNWLRDRGDNLDALSLFPPSTGYIFFSLDASYVDPLEVFPANSGTAGANGFRPGDILVSKATGAPPILWAPHNQLGLGPQDDIDALIVWDNGNGVFNLPPTPYDWVFGAHDMIFFSVRRGSPILGTPDAFWGMPIEEGDVLQPNASGIPGIFIPAEMLGLATVRSGLPLPFGFADDLDALALR